MIVGLVAGVIGGIIGWLTISLGSLFFAWWLSKD